MIWRKKSFGARWEKVCHFSTLCACASFLPPLRFYVKSSSLMVCQTRVLIFVHVNVHKIWVAKTPYAITHFEMIAQFLNLVNGLISDWKIDCYFVQVMQSYSLDSKITSLVWFSMTKKISLKMWKSFKIQIGGSFWMTSNWSNQQTFLCLPNLEVCTWHLKFATHF